MTVFDRILLFLGSLIALISLVGLLPFAFGWMGIYYLNEIALQLSNLENSQIIFPIILLVLILLSLRLFIVSISGKSGPDLKAVRKEGVNGFLSISTLTIEHLAERISSSINGLEEVRTKVRMDEAGVRIEVRGFADGKHNIPWIGDEVQKRVKQEVETITGIEIPQIHVYIEDLVDERLKRNPDKR